MAICAIIIRDTFHLLNLCRSQDREHWHINVHRDISVLSTCLSFFVKIQDLQKEVSLFGSDNFVSSNAQKSLWFLGTFIASIHHYWNIFLKRTLLSGTYLLEITRC